MERQIVVDLFSDENAQWWWEAEACKLRRGPFAHQNEADQDADENAELVISVLAARGLGRR